MAVRKLRKRNSRIKKKAPCRDGAGMCSALEVDHHYFIVIFVIMSIIQDMPL